jgi:hypothetical protein
LFENLLEIKIRVAGRPNSKTSRPRKPAAFTFKAAASIADGAVASMGLT